MSDTAERKWYDEHRDAILRGWSASDGGGGAGSADILFDVVPYQHPGCFRGFDSDDENGFYGVYRHVFESVWQGEKEGWVNEGNIDDIPHEYPVDFGDADTDWPQVAAFYQSWESFSSCLAFAWADEYDIHGQAEQYNRRVRRAMDDANKKKRRTAKRERNEQILSLVRFVKRRDPRVVAYKQQQEERKLQQAKERQEEMKRKKLETQQAREEWRRQAEEEMAKAEEEDRLAGRVRLADLDDDYDYGGGGKKGKGKKKKNRGGGGRKKKNGKMKTQGVPIDANDEKDDEVVDAHIVKDATNIDGDGDNKDKTADDTVDVQDDDEHPDEDVNTQNTQQEEYRSGDENDHDNDLFDYEVDDVVNDDGSILSSSSESSDEPDVWRCEICRKDFKSGGQLENHLKSKKHKEAFKKYQKKLQKEAAVMDSLLNAIALEGF